MCLYTGSEITMYTNRRALLTTPKTLHRFTYTSFFRTIPVPVHHFWSFIHPRAQAAKPHTDPLNLTPEVREAHALFYNLDYDGALSRFEAIQRANPQNPMATNYVLYTSSSANSIIKTSSIPLTTPTTPSSTSKRDVPVPQAHP